MLQTGRAKSPGPWDLAHPPLQLPPCWKAPRVGPCGPRVMRNTRPKEVIKDRGGISSRLLPGRKSFWEMVHTHKLSQPLQLGPSPLLHFLVGLHFFKPLGWQKQTLRPHCTSLSTCKEGLSPRAPRPGQDVAVTIRRHCKRIRG